jgi:hypothetical protein
MKIIWQVRQEKDLSKQALSKFNAYFYLSNVEWNYKPVWHIGGSEQREKFELLFIHERTSEKLTSGFSMKAFVLLQRQLYNNGKIIKRFRSNLNIYKLETIIHNESSQGIWKYK